MRAARLVFIGLILLSTVGSFANAQRTLAAGSLMVTKLADTNDGVCDSDCSLREAIAVAPADATITFAPGLSGTIIVTSEIDFTKGLTITGPIAGNITLDANKQGNIFNFTPDNASQNPLLTLKNLTFINAGNSALRIINASLTLSHCTVLNGQSLASGGGMQFYSVSGGDIRLLIDASTFTNNVAQEGSGGAIKIHVENDLGFVATINDSQFISNDASAGGAILVNNVSSPGTFTINRSTFDSNVGGAISSFGGNYIINQSLFTNNTAINGGAGIDNSGDLLVVGSLFTGNNFYGTGHGGSGGGAIRNSSGNVTVANTTFTANAVGTVFQNLGSAVNLVNDTIAGNTDSVGVGVLSNYTMGGTFTLANTIVANNSLPPCANLFPFIDGGHNIQYPGTSCGATIISVDPKLGALANNGGLTQTIALLPGSPAIDAGDNAICAASPVSNVDQRGVARPFGAQCDIGAYEYNIPPTPTPTNTVTPSSTTAPSTTTTLTSTTIPTSTPTTTNTPTPRILTDTVGIYRPSAGEFFLKNTNVTGFADLYIPYTIPGTTNVYPIVGDWTGGGIDTIGLFSRDDGTFALRNSNTSGPADEQLVLGIPGDVPMAGRWTVDALHDGIGVFRPSNGLIYLKKDLTSGFADYTMVLGTPGDTAVAADWNGKGFDSPGVYRPAQQTFYLSNQVTNGSVFGDYQVQLGILGDQPIAGDWIAQGHAGVGVFRPTDGQIYLKYALTSGFADTGFVLGVAGDVPVAGHWIAVGAVHQPSLNLIVPGTPAPVTRTPTFAPTFTVKVSPAPNYDG